MKRKPLLEKFLNELLSQEQIFTCSIMQEWLHPLNNVLLNILSFFSNSNFFKKPKHFPLDNVTKKGCLIKQGET